MSTSSDFCFAAFFFLGAIVLNRRADHSGKTPVCCLLCHRCEREAAEFRASFPHSGTRQLRRAEGRENRSVGNPACSRPGQNRHCANKRWAALGYAVLVYSRKNGRT